MQLIPSLITQASFTPGARDVQVTPGMSVFGGAGGRENEGRLQVDGISIGRAGQRRRRLRLHRRRHQRAGGGVHDVGRSGRSRSRRADDEHRAEDGRQHVKGTLLRWPA